MATSSPDSVAIACQGGGSHTAFTAGALKRILRERDPTYRISALTGTSGGALCAFATWYGLRTGGHEKAIRLLDDLWACVEASTPRDRFVNRGLVEAIRLREMGFPVWQPPVPVGSRIGQRWLRRTVTSLVDGRPVEDLHHRTSDDRDGSGPPKILVSAVDVTDGAFTVFTDRPDEEPAADGGAVAVEAQPLGERRIQERVRPITIDSVVASASVPPLIDAVERTGADGTTHYYWDGLFSQNPPVKNLLSGPETVEDKPDEIWIVRIEPTCREGRPVGLEAIDDRRTELAGSLSLNQELLFIERVNDWLEDGRFTEAFAETVKPVTVRVVELDEDRLDPPRDLVTATKYDRDPALIAALESAGERQAEAFLSNPDAHAIVD